MIKCTPWPTKLIFFFHSMCIARKKHNTILYNGIHISVSVDVGINKHVLKER